MDDLQSRTQELMREIEFKYLKGQWRDQMIEMGIDEKDANRWAAEIGHIVDEYERSLSFLVDAFDNNDSASLAESLEGWVAYTRDISKWKLEDVTTELQGAFDKYLPPPEPDDTDLD